MGVDLHVDDEFYEIGAASFFHSFFSNIAYHLEQGKWGRNFPIIMNHLYQGELEYDEISKAKNELLEIKRQLCNIKPSKVIWDIEDLSLQPPWGNNISDDVTDLSNYFVTSDGRDLIEVILEAFDYALENESDCYIE